MDWIITNWSYVLSGFFALIVFASIVVRLTPTKKDDGVLYAIIKVLDRVSLAKTSRDRELIKIAREELAKVASAGEEAKEEAPAEPVKEEPAKE